jgi:EmrB/QacA subfamily drug resistance transporter
MVGKSNPAARSGAGRVIWLVVVTAVFMSNLDLWIVNVALVDMGRSLGGSLSSLSWILNAYAVTLAALLIPAGRLGDRIGHRQVFLAGIALFTASSIACALADDVVVLVLARVFQAAGAAAQLPTSLALLLASVPEPRRVHAARGWAAVGALSAVAGPVLGGLLVTLSWRWVFIVNVPFGIAALVAGRRVLPRPAAKERTPFPDLLGSALLVVAVAALTGALVEAPDWGWLAPGTGALVAAAVVGGVVFVQRCRVHPAPMLELPLLRVPRFAVANLAVFVFSVAFAIMLLSNSLWCQDVWRWSALRTGLAMAPGPAMVPIVTILSARLVHRLGANRIAAAGSVIFAASMSWRVAFAGVAPDYARDLLPSMLAGGVGVGLALGTLIAAGATALPAHRSATASAIVNSGRQIASALGVAVLVTLLGAHSADVLGAFRAGWWVAGGLGIAAALASLLIPPAAPGGAPAAARTDARDRRTAAAVGTGEG